MANCPICKAPDFYPSFSGKGECTSSKCSLYVTPPPSKSPWSSCYDVRIDYAAWVPDPGTELHISPHPLDDQDVDDTDEKGIAYTPDEVDDYEATLRDSTVAVGILATYMSGSLISVPECQGIAQQLVDNVGLPLHTWIPGMVNMATQAREVWFMGAKRKLSARIIGTGYLSFVVR